MLWIPGVCSGAQPCCTSGHHCSLCVFSPSPSSLLLPPSLVCVRTCVCTSHSIHDEVRTYRRVELRSLDLAAGAITSWAISSSGNTWGFCLVCIPVLGPSTNSSGDKGPVWERFMELWWNSYCVFTLCLMYSLAANSFVTDLGYVMLETHRFSFSLTELLAWWNHITFYS